MDTLVSEILEEYPQAEKIFAKHGVELGQECHGVLDNPLELCETMCSIDDMEALLKDLREMAGQG